MSRGQNEAADFIEELDVRTRLLGNYFAILDELFSKNVIKGKPRAFFDNKLLQDQRSKMSAEIKMHKLLNYFFDYDNDMMMSTSDFLTFLVLSRLSWATSDGVHLTKTDLKKKEHVEHLGKVKEYNRFLLRLVNMLLAIDIVYPNKKNDKENGYDEVFEDIKRKLVEGFLHRIGDDAIRSVSEKLGETVYRVNDLTNEYVEKATEYFWKKAPALIPKTKGLAEELFVYYYLTYKCSGYYVVPLLLHQRFYSSLGDFRELIAGLDERIKASPDTCSEKQLSEFLRAYREFRYMAIPPDYLVLSKGRIFGLECGRGKEEQIADFAAITGVPTIFVDAGIYLGKNSRGFGLKCDRCYHPFLFCDEYIEREIEGKSAFYQLSEDERYCGKICKQEKTQTCKYSVVTLTPGKWKTLTGKKKEYSSYFHFQCLPPLLRKKIGVSKLVPPIPFIHNLDKLEIGL